MLRTLLLLQVLFYPSVGAPHSLVLLKRFTERVDIQEVLKRFTERVDIQEAGMYTHLDREATVLWGTEIWIAAAHPRL